MEKFLGQEYPESRREQFLKDNCDAVEEIGYTRRFTPDELNQKKELLANASIEINDIEEEKKRVMAEFKERLKPLDEERKSLLGEIRSKAQFVNEECYKFIDHETRMVAYYNKLGEMVSSRPAMPQEMQKTIFNLQKAAQ